MYTIAKAKPAWKTQCLTRDGSRIKEICIRVEPECLALKTKGTRTWHRLPYRYLFQKAVEATVAANRDAKRKRKIEIKRGGVR